MGFSGIINGKMAAHHVSGKGERYAYSLCMQRSKYAQKPGLALVFTGKNLDAVSA